MIICLFLPNTFLNISDINIGNFMWLNRLILIYYENFNFWYLNKILNYLIDFNDIYQCFMAVLELHCSFLLAIVLSMLTLRFSISLYLVALGLFDRLSSHISWCKVRSNYSILSGKATVVDAIKQSSIQLSTRSR